MPASPYHFCTYFDQAYLTRGLALYESLIRHCRRPFVLWILCFDEETHAVLSRMRLPNVRLVSAEEFERDNPELPDVKGSRSLVEYYWTSTPLWLLYVLRQSPDMDVATYLDADLLFFADPQPMYEEMVDQSVLIIEHRYSPEHSHFAERSGIYNVGAMSFRRDEAGVACLNWWRDRCLEWCFSKSEGGKFGDQKYLDDWPARFQRVAVLQHKGAGLAPWNASRYRVARTGQRFTVDGLDLVFFHLHGFVRFGPYVVRPCTQDYQRGVRAILDLYLLYAACLRRADRRARSAGVTAPAEHPWKSRADLMRALVHHDVVWAGPPLAAKLMWRLCDRHRAALEEKGKAFEAYRAGDRGTAKRCVSRVMALNPFLAVDRYFIPVLLDVSGGWWLVKFVRRLKRLGRSRRTTAG